jgi:hypothetical protein
VLVAARRAIFLPSRDPLWDEKDVREKETKRGGATCSMWGDFQLNGGSGIGKRYLHEYICSSQYLRHRKVDENCQLLRERIVLITCINFKFSTVILRFGVYPLRLWAVTGTWSS